MRRVAWEKNLRTTAVVSVFSLALLSTGCGVTLDRGDGPPEGSVDVSSVPDAVPRPEAHSRYGNMRSYVVKGQRYYTLKSSQGFRERGIASWYGKKFHGRRTSTQEVYDMYAMTAAHKSLPLPTYVEVTNLKNRRRVIVRVNDRGPFYANRVIDLSYAAAYRLGIIKAGTGLVEIRALDPSAPIQATVPPIEEVPVGVPARLYLQVGAFAELVNAKRLSQRLKAMTEFVVQISELGEAGRTLYRVRLGPFDRVEQIDRLTRLLAQVGIDGVRAVVE